MSPPTPWHSLRHYRLKAGLTHAKLAQAADMSESGVQHLEAGRRSPRPQTVTRLANALKIPADKLRADLANNPAAEEQLAELTQQVEVLAERIKQVTATLPDQRAKTEQGAA